MSNEITNVTTGYRVFTIERGLLVPAQGEIYNRDRFQWSFNTREEAIENIIECGNYEEYVILEITQRSFSHGEGY